VRARRGDEEPRLAAEPGDRGGDLSLTSEEEPGVLGVEGTESAATRQSIKSHNPEDGCLRRRGRSPDFTLDLRQESGVDRAFSKGQ
jgi:hypothetical protein